MIEFSLVFGVNAIGLFFTIGLVRWLLARDAGSVELRRLGNAIERAVQGFLWGQLQRVAFGLLLVTCVVFSAYGFVPGNQVGRLDSGLWAVLGVILGGVGATILAYVSANIAHRSSIRSVAAARLSLDRSLSITVRAGGASGLLAETLSAILLISFIGLVAGLRGAFTGGFTNPEILATVAALLPSLALGAATAGLILQRGGSIYHAAGDIGGDSAGERVSGLSQDDARNPALVADLVGDHVGSIVGRSLTTYVAAMAGQVAMLIIGIKVFQLNISTLPGALGLVVLPLVIRGFGMLASCFGLLIIRTGENTPPEHAMWRGQLVTWLISLTGIVGATYWLLDTHWWYFSIAGAIGLISTAAVGQLMGWLKRRSQQNHRDQSEALREGAGAIIGAGLASNLGTALLPFAALGLSLSLAHWVGTKNSLVESGLLALLVATAALTSPAPFLLALSQFSPLADNARGIASLSRSASIQDVDRRTEQLDQIGFSLVTPSSVQLLLAGASGVLLSLIAAPYLASALPSVGLQHPAVVWTGLLGMGLVLAYASITMDQAGRAARTLSKEVERQLRSIPRGNSPGAGREFTPAYKVCIDLAGKSALDRLTRPVLFSLAVPLVLVILLRKIYGSGEPSIALQALVSFLAMSSATGLMLALVAGGLKTSLGAIRRSTRGRPASEVTSAAIGGDTFGDIFGNVGGPAAFLFTLAATASVLIAAPFLS